MKTKKQTVKPPSSRAMVQNRAVAPTPKTPTVPKVTPPVMGLQKGKAAPLLGVSTEPSDAPMRQAATRSQVKPLPKVPKLPALNPKKVGSKPGPRKPKMGMG